MTFDTFVAGAPNEMALGVAKQVAHAALNNAVTFNPVYIHSTVGLGKSHLLNAIAWAAGAADSSRNIVYLTADHFMYHFIQAVQRQSALAFKDWLRRVDLLLIDDMQFLPGQVGDRVRPHARHAPDRRQAGGGRRRQPAARSRNARRAGEVAALGRARRPDQRLRRRSPPRHRPQARRAGDAPGSASTSRRR